jgi:peptide-methionine (R)-S-oxide reductase
MTSALSATLLLAGCSLNSPMHTSPQLSRNDSDMSINLQQSEEEWKESLNPIQFHILREKGTERPYSGQYDKFFEPGTYHCVGCGQALFASDTKFDSGCGWPAFFAPLIENNMNISIDRSHGMIREEVTCSRCGGHLGHVFNDGPAPTYRRYCINSAAMKFEAAVPDSSSAR